MAIGKITELTQFTGHPEWFGAFLRNTNQKAVQQATLVSGLERNPQLLEKIKDPNSRLRILLLGAGVGNSEIGFLSYIRNLRNGYGLSRITAYYDDPSGPMRDGFEANARIAGVAHRIMRYDTVPFEAPSYKPPRGIDLALCFQMWHYVGDWQGIEPKKNSLVKLAGTLRRETGVAIVSLQSVASDNYTIRRKYIPKIHNQIEITSDDIVAELARLRIPYDYTVIDSTTDLASVFPEGDFKPTQEGKDLLSFILRIRWNELPPELKEEIKNDVMELAGKAHTLTFRDGYIWIGGI